MDNNLVTHIWPVPQVTCIPTHWSEVVAFRTLDKLQVGISDGRSASFRGARPLEETQEANQRIGEDFMMLSWGWGLPLSFRGGKAWGTFAVMDVCGGGGACAGVSVCSDRI